MDGGFSRDEGQGSVKTVNYFTAHFSGSGLKATLLRALAGGAGLQIGGLALSFLVGVQLARNLGPAGYGVYAFALSAASLIGIVTEFGLPQVALRETSVSLAMRDWGLLRGVAQFGVGSVAVSSILVILLLELVLRTTPLELDEQRRAALEWGLLFVPLASQAKIFSYMLMGLGSIVLGQFANLVLRPGLFALLLAAVTLLHGGLLPQSAMALQVVGAAAAALFTGVFLIRKAPPGVWQTRSQVKTRAWMTAAWPMAISMGLSVAQAQMAVLLLGALSTPAETGLFRVADSTANICGFAVSLLNAVAISLFANLWARKEFDQLQRLVSVTTLLAIGGVLLVTAPVAIFGRFLLGPIFGAPFVESYPTLLIACCSNFSYGVFGLGASLLNMTGRERRVTRAAACSLVVSLILAVLLIPGLGSRGAALANVAGAFSLGLLASKDCGIFLSIDTSLLGAWRLWRGRVLYL